MAPHRRGANNNATHVHDRDRNDAVGVLVVTFVQAGVCLAQDVQKRGRLRECNSICDPTIFNHSAWLFDALAAS